MTHILARGIFTAAIALACATAATAATTEQTRIGVHADGETHIVRVGDMQVGEVRSIVTESGTPAVLTRTESGLLLEVDNKRHAITLAREGDGRHEGVRIVKKHSAHHAADHDLEAEADDAFVDAVAQAAESGEASGQDRVVVVRTVRRID